MEKELEEEALRLAQGKGAFHNFTSWTREITGFKADMVRFLELPPLPQHRSIFFSGLISLNVVRGGRFHNDTDIQF